MGTRSKKDNLILGRTRNGWGKIIRKKRRELEMSQGTLAKELDISIVGVCNIEKGLYSLSEEKLLLVCKILEI
jgi:DNA-binding XRE family transcriptional regulator